MEMLWQMYLQEVEGEIGVSFCLVNMTTPSPRFTKYTYDHQIASH